MLDVHSDADHHRSVFTLAGDPRARWPTRCSREPRVARRADRRDARAGRGPARRRSAPARRRARRRSARLSVTGGHGARRARRRWWWPTASARSCSCRCSSTASCPAIDRAGARTRRSCAAAAWPAGRATRCAARTASRRTSARRTCIRARGATLVAARPPLVAFNLQLAAPADGRRGAARSPRRSARGAAGACRACARSASRSSGGVAQVSMNVERPLEMPLARVVEAVRAHAEVASAELVGLAPGRAFAGFPQDVPMPGFDPAAPPDRERTRLLSVAQTRRKRQTKHRGNAAGVVESRGRTGRKPTAAEKSGDPRTLAREKAEAARQARPAANLARRVRQGDVRGDRAAAGRHPAAAQSNQAIGAVPDRARRLHRRSATTPTSGCTTAASASRPSRAAAEGGVR